MEYATRAGTTSAYYNGKECTYDEPNDKVRDTNLDPLAWYGPDWHEGGEEKGPGTREVGLKLPNQWGLFDTLAMYGKCALTGMGHMRQTKKLLLIHLALFWEKSVLPAEEAGIPGLQLPVLQTGRKQNQDEWRDSGWLVLQTILIPQKHI